MSPGKIKELQNFNTTLLELAREASQKSTQIVIDPVTAAELAYLIEELIDDSND